MDGTRSSFYKEKYHRIASDVRKLCRLYNANYVDSITESFLNNHKYAAAEDAAIQKKFDALCEKFLFAGRWTDREMLLQMTKDFKLLNLEACDDNRCALERSRIDSRYTASSGILEVLMCLANSPTLAGKAVYVSEDFLSLEQLSFIIPKRKEFIDMSEFKISNDSYIDWLSEYDNDEEMDENEPTLPSVDAVVRMADVKPTTRHWVDDDKLAYLEADVDNSVYFLYGNTLVNYPSGNDISFNMDGATTATATVVARAVADIPNKILCNESDIVKMILEMLQGNENELYLLGDEGFVLTSTAARVRISSESLSPTVLSSVLIAFAELGTIILAARVYACDCSVDKIGIPSAIKANVLHHLELFDQQISDYEVALFSQDLRRVSLLNVCIQLRRWKKLFSSIQFLLDTLKTTFTTSDALFVQTPENTKKIVDYGIMQELVACMDLYSLSSISSDMQAIVQGNHKRSAASDSSYLNITLDLPFDNSGDLLFGFYNDTFFGCVSIYLDAFMHSLWTGVLHKKIKEDKRLEEATNTEVREEPKKSAAEVEKDKRAARFNDIISSFQSAAQTFQKVGDKQTEKLIVVLLTRDAHPIEQAIRNAMVEAPPFLRPVAVQALLSDMDLALVNKHSHLSSEQHFISSKQLHSASRITVDGLRSLGLLTPHDVDLSGLAAAAPSYQSTHFRADGVDFSIVPPSFPSCFLSNVSLAFNDKGKNVLDRVSEYFARPSTCPPPERSVEVKTKDKLHEVKDFTLLSQASRVLVEAPLIHTIRSIQSTAVEILRSRFLLDEHMAFCSNVFLMRDNRLFEPLRTKCLNPISSREITAQREAALVESSLSHTLAYLMNLHVPPESTTSLSVEIKDEEKVGVNALKKYSDTVDSKGAQQQTNGVLTTVSGLRVNVVFGWPLSEIITIAHVDSYNKILQYLLMMSSAKWAADSIWKHATAPAALSKSATIALVDAKAKKGSTIALYHRSCLAGLFWFQFIISGLLHYYLYHIHETIWAEYTDSLAKCLSTFELTYCHEHMIREVQLTLNTLQGQIIAVVNVGHRATNAFNVALALLSSPAVDIDEVALGITSDKSKPLIELFFERADASYKALKSSVSAVATALETAHAASKVGKLASLDYGFHELRAVFRDTKNWT